MCIGRVLLDLLRSIQAREPPLVFVVTLREPAQDARVSGQAELAAAEQSLILCAQPAAQCLLACIVNHEHDTVRITRSVIGFSDARELGSCVQLALLE